MAWKGSLLLVLILVAAAPLYFSWKVERSNGKGSFLRDAQNKLRRAQIRFVDEFLGPESLAFDSVGMGPYTGVSDGRVLRWDGPESGWSDFAFTAFNRSAACNAKYPFVADLENEHLCGRPLGLRFHPHTGDLYIADAYYGLCRVAPEGGYAKPLVTQAEGIPLTFTNDVDFGDEHTVFFTDSSSKYHRRDFAAIFAGEDASGRLLSHNLKSKETKVLLRGLRFPNGIAVSEDKSFLVLAETIPCRVLKYWLKGPKAGTVEELCQLPGYPDNIRMTERGDFWVAIHGRPNVFLKLPIVFRHLLLRLQLPLTKWYTALSRKAARGMVIRFSGEGEILEVLEDDKGKVVKLVSEVHEKEGELWMGSVVLTQIAVY